MYDIQPPAPGGLDSLTPDPTDIQFAYQQLFPTQAALDAAFITDIYAIQVTAVHDGWLPLVANAAPGGQLTFTDTQASNFPNRFYRGRPSN